MLPVTSAPAAETLPSVMLSVERVCGSQLPLFVTTVTFQSPSYGVWAIAGALAIAAAVRVEAQIAKPMRYRRMNQIPDMCICVMTRLIRAHCVQNLLRRSNHKSSCGIKHLIRGLVPPREQKFT